MMASSIDDGGIEFRGTDATLKINRAGFTVYREGAPRDENPVLSARSYRDGTIDHIENFFNCIKSRKEPNAPVETGISAARAGHIGNVAYHRGGMTPWPVKGRIAAISHLTIGVTMRIEVGCQRTYRRIASQCAGNKPLSKIDFRFTSK